jgi:hypothetical protein
LLLQSLSRDSRVGFNCILDVWRQGRQFLDKLSSNRCNKHSCVAIVAFTPLEEEASAEVSLVGECLGHCAGDYRFASARYAVQPEYMFAASIASLGIYLSK